MKKQNHLILSEFEFLQCKCEDKANYISEKTFELVENFILKNEEIAQYLKLTSKRGYGKVLQAQNYVGLIQTKDGTTIEILPKIYKVDKKADAKDILLKMLKTLKNSPFKNIDFANIKSSKMPLLEIFISMFLDEMFVLLQRGIKSDYIQKEDNLQFSKGKLLIKEQLRRNFIYKEKFYVVFDEFSPNRAENRLIKTTLEFLYKKSKLNRNQQRIKEFLFIFDEVGISKNIKNDFAKIKKNRQMKAYEIILLWCKTFLQENSFCPYKGDEKAFALLFDMNLLFESFVGNYLKKEAKYEVSLQDRGKYLVENYKKFALKPDIVLNNGEKIADTKWKIVESEKDISSSDMYQLYAYGTKYEKCKELYIIYPFCGQNLDLNYKFNDNLSLKVLFFDLSEIISKTNTEQKYNLSFS